MVAVQVLVEPQPWSEPVDDRQGLVVVPPLQRRRALPDRATRIRRRRLAVLIVAIVLVTGVVALARAIVYAGSSHVTQTSPTPITESVYVVQPGDTLWSIAERLAPDGDPRPIVEELRDLNGGTDLEVGTRLSVADI
jgi:hypothetical protein